MSSTDRSQAEATLSTGQRFRNWKAVLDLQPIVQPEPLRVGASTTLIIDAAESRCARRCRRASTPVFCYSRSLKRRAMGAIGLKWQVNSPPRKANTIRSWSVTTRRLTDSRSQSTLRRCTDRQLGGVARAAPRGCAGLSRLRLTLVSRRIAIRAP